MRCAIAVALCCAIVLPSVVRADALPPGRSAGIPSSGSGPVAADLRDLLDRAWAVSRRDEVEAARLDVLGARELATRAAFAGAPVAGIDLRRDLPRGVTPPGTEQSTLRGRDEWDLAVSAPVWLPGQRDVQRRVIERDRAQLSAEVLHARWRLAGAVREAVWALQAARAVAARQQAREAAAEALERDVARRVEAGDLAPADLLMARAETLAARAAAREAGAAVTTSVLELRRLAGVTDVADPSEADAPESADAADAHPALRAAREGVEAARSRLEEARLLRRDNPVVNASTRFDRDVRDGPYRNTFRVGVSVPLDTEARNAPRITAAAAQLAETELVWRQAMRDVDADVAAARAGLEAARAMREADAERARVTAATLAAYERAFRAGERGLPELLRVRAAALDAALDDDTARARLERARARLRQALGLLP